MLHFYHGINYLYTASDLDAFYNEGIVVQWMCVQDEGRHIMGQKQSGCMSIKMNWKFFFLSSTVKA